MKGKSKVPFEFFFLKDEAGNNDSMLRKRCSEAAQEHKLNIDGLITKLNKDCVNLNLDEENKIEALA